MSAFYTVGRLFSSFPPTTLTAPDLVIVTVFPYFLSFYCWQFFLSVCFTFTANKHLSIPGLLFGSHCSALYCIFTACTAGRHRGERCGGLGRVQHHAGGGGLRPVHPAKPSAALVSHLQGLHSVPGVHRGVALHHGEQRGDLVSSARHSVYCLLSTLP